MDGLFVRVEDVPLHAKQYLFVLGRGGLDAVDDGHLEFSRLSESSTNDTWTMI